MRFVVLGTWRHDAAVAVAAVDYPSPVIELAYDCWFEIVEAKSAGEAMALAPKQKEIGVFGPSETGGGG